MQDKIFKILPWVLLVIVIMLLLKTCNDKKDQSNLYNATQDTLKLERNDKDQQRASIELLTSTSTKQFLDIKTKDSTIKDLQDLVKQYKDKLQSATILSVVTSVNTHGKTIITLRDTIVKDSITYIYPEYTRLFNNKWYSANMRMNKDSSILKFRTFNDFKITQSLEKQSGFFGFMKPKIPIASVLNLNPYTETKEFRTFTVKCECHNTRWFVLGNASGAVGAILLRDLLTK